MPFCKEAEQPASIGDQPASIGRRSMENDAMCGV